MFDEDGCEIRASSDCSGNDRALIEVEMLKVENNGVLDVPPILV